MGHQGRLFGLWAKIFLLAVFFLPACADRDAPTSAQVQTLLTAFFETQGYKVVSLDLGAIEGAPLAQKTYGKKRAFYVTVKRLVLEGKGQIIIRENGVVVVRQKAVVSDDWEIERVPPELAP